MLSESALALIRDVFSRPQLFQNAHRIRRREVAWRSGEPRTVFEHSAVVVSEEQLLAELPKPDTARGEALYTLTATGSPSVRFGTRFAAATPATPSDPAACRIEAFPDGWVFHIPNSTSSEWILTVGGENGFFSAPAIAETLSGPRWLALGSAAMAFDPICGDGTAHAIREAVLASACVRAIYDGQPEAAVRAHYESRMLLGFRRHLALVHSFYHSGQGGPWWDTEAGAAARGIAWCDERIAAFGPPRYRLEGAELICLP
jgi:2-polyprenyl-6-methoxyphenol hydroxylase-like FAD-dependent oxidoreductase